MRLRGISCAVPRTEVPAEQACDRLGADSVRRIVANTGVTTRRVAGPETTAADLCVASAGPLLDRLGWDRGAIELLLFVTQTPDYLLPASSYRIHRDLGLSERCMALDIGLGCSGFTHALLLARGLMSAGQVARALVLCGDTITRLAHPMDRSTALLFGDAGAAAALDNDGPDQFRGAAWGSDGSGLDHLIVPAGGFRRPHGPEQLIEAPDEQGNIRRPVDLSMDGAQVFNFTLKRVPPMIQQVLGQAGWRGDDVDAFVFHQANRFIIEYLRKKLKLPPEKVPTCLERFGNASSASIPQTLVVRLGDRLAGPLRLLLAGFGVGLSWSGVALETDGCAVVPLIEV